MKSFSMFPTGSSMISDSPGRLSSKQTSPNQLTATWPLSTAWIPSSLSVPVRHHSSFCTGPGLYSPFPRRRIDDIFRNGKLSINRTKTIHVIICKTPKPGKSSNNEAYNQFAELLNKTQPPARSEFSSPTASSDTIKVSHESPQRTGKNINSLSDDYAKFSKHLGDVPESQAEKEKRIKNDYAKFAQYLSVDKKKENGDEVEASSTPVEQPQTSFQLSEEQKLSKEQQYAEFSQLLGMDEDRSTIATNSKRSLYSPETILDSKASSASPSAQTPISRHRTSQSPPTNYSMFDELLKKSGGKGQKSMKGSKRWASVSSSMSSSSDFNDDEVSIGGADENGEERKSGSTSSSTTAPNLSKFSAQHAFEDYSIMEKEFGTGYHETPGKVSGTSNSGEGNLPELLKPPRRPSDRLASQLREDVPAYTYDEVDIDIPSAEIEVEPVPMLQPKPIIPGTVTDSSESDNAEAEERRVDVKLGFDVSPTSAPPTVPTAPLPPPVSLQPKPARPADIPKPNLETKTKPANSIELELSSMNTIGENRSPMESAAQDGKVDTSVSVEGDDVEVMSSGLTSTIKSLSTPETTTATTVSSDTTVVKVPGLVEKPLRPGTLPIDEVNVTNETVTATEMMGIASESLDVTNDDGFSTSIVEEYKEPEPAAAQLIGKATYREEFRPQFGLQPKSKQKSFVRGTTKNWDELEAIVLENPKFIEELTQMNKS